jgi:hypothetical protein
MTEEAGISLVQMMENAGRCLAAHARGMLGGDARGRQVVVLAGRGGNGGGGLAAARRLAGWGAVVTVVLAQSHEDMRGVPRQQLTILDWIGIPVRLGADGIAERSTVQTWSSMRSSGIACETRRPGQSRCSFRRRMPLAVRCWLSTFPPGLTEIVARRRTARFAPRKR